MSVFTMLFLLSNSGLVECNYLELMLMRSSSAGFRSRELDGITSGVARITFATPPYVLVFIEPNFSLNSVVPEALPY